MSDIVLESKLNNHSLEELNSFGDFVLSKIKDIRAYGDDELICKLNQSLNYFFQNLEVNYPERYITCVTLSIRDKRVYYRFDKWFKGEKHRILSKSSKEIHKRVFEFCKHNKVDFYRGVETNFFLNEPC